MEAQRKMNVRGSFETQHFVCVAINHQDACMGSSSTVPDSGSLDCQVELASAVIHVFVLYALNIFPQHFTKFVIVSTMSS